MTLEQWGIVYGMAASTAALIWQGVEKFKSRRRLDFFIGLGHNTSINPDRDGYYDEY